MRNATPSMNAEINVTPFLDVLLVLLILFMYLCLSQQKVIAAQLPDPNAGAMTDRTAQIVLEVQPNSTYAINSHVILAEHAAARLRAIFAGRLAKAIMIRATTGVRYQEVVTAMDIAKGAGVVVIGLDHQVVSSR